MESTRHIAGDMKITFKLALLFAVAATGLILFYLISGSIQEQTKIGGGQYKEIITAKDLTADILPPPEYILESYMTALQYINETDVSRRDGFITYMKTLKQQYIERHDYWDGVMQDNEARQLLLVDAYKYALEFYDVFFSEAIAAKDSGSTAGLRAAADKLDQAYSSHREYIDKAVTAASKMASDVEAQTAVTLENGRVELIVFLLAIALAGLVLFAFISLSITKPIKYVTEKVKTISRGDLGVTIDGKYIGRSETGQICSAVGQMAHMLNTYVSEINRVLNSVSSQRLDITFSESFEGDFKPLEVSMTMIVDSLNDTLQEISISASEVNTGSKQVAAAAQVLSQGATEQASAIQQLTASIEEIASQTNLNAQNAGKASDFADEARKNADKGNARMRDMLKAMDDIRASSNSINKIIKVIDDIAFQTNILALNAAVEAARAGQHGKGFAVVAEEVRTLASKSANAAKETTALIEDSIGKVKSGTAITSETAEALSEIAVQVDNAAELVNSIAAASREQAMAIEQVNQGIMQVSQVVQTNAATAEESAAASEELSGQAAQLRETVGVFKLKDSYMYHRSQGAFEAKKIPAYKSAAEKAGTAPGAARIMLSDEEFGKY